MSRSVTCSRATTTPTWFSCTIPSYCKRADGDGDGHPCGPGHPKAQGQVPRWQQLVEPAQYHGGVEDGRVVIDVGHFHDGGGRVGEAEALLVGSLDDQRVVGSGL